jgi:citrate synthase
MNDSKTHATLKFSDSDQTIDLPIYKGTLGPDVIDIRKLYGQTGKFVRPRLYVDGGV